MKIFKHKKNKIKKEERAKNFNFSFLNEKENSISDAYDNADKEKKVKKHKAFDYAKMYFRVTVVFFIMLVLYFSFSFLKNKIGRKDSIEVYEVQSGELIKLKKEKGIIYRQEKVTYADKSGYVNFFPVSNSRINKGNVVCIINDNPQNILKNSDNSNIDFDRLAKEIRNFSVDVNNLHFHDVYNYNANLNSLVSELNMMSKLDEIVSSNSVRADAVSYSQDAGVISYVIDGFEDDTEYDFNTKQLINSFNVNVINQNDTISKGSPLYKIVTSPDYDIVFSSKNDYSDILSKGKIMIKFQYDKTPVEAKISDFVGNGGNRYYKITLNKYLERFLDRRVIDFEIVENNESGLKIPTSSLIEKNCYVIPKNFLRKTKDGDDAFFVTDTEGNVTEVLSNISKADNDNYYVSTDDRVGGLNYNSVIVDENGNRFILEKVTRFTGAYNINKGYAVFKNVDILERTNEYAIISKNTQRGLVIYDRIVLDASKVKEGDLIS